MRSSKQKPNPSNGKQPQLTPNQQTLLTVMTLPSTIDSAPLKDGKLALSYEESFEIAKKAQLGNSKDQAAAQAGFEKLAGHYLPADLEVARSHLKKKNYELAERILKRLSYETLKSTLSQKERDAILSAKVELGRMYEYEEIKSEKDHRAKAFKCYEEAHQQGSSEGTFYLSLCYEKGISVAKDAAKARQLLEESALARCPAAEYELGYRVVHGKYGMPQDIKNGLAWLYNADQDGSGSASEELARIYDEGILVEQDDKKAFDFYLKAAQPPHSLSYAQYKVGKFIAAGDVVLKDEKLAFSWYEQASLHHNPDRDAQYKLAQCYELGKGIAPDFKHALEWYEKSAKNGSRKALTRLGDCYRRGDLNQVKDEKKASEYYEKGAKLDCKYAQYHFAKYLQKYHLDRKAEIEEWYKESADQGYRPAYFALYRYFKPIDQRRSYGWLEKAAEKGYPKALYEYANKIINMGVSSLDEETKDDSGWRPDSNLEDVIDLLEEASKSYAPALRLLAKCYLNGLDISVIALFVRRDSEAAVKCLENGIAKNDPRALFMLAQVYEHGASQFEPNHSKAIELYRQFYEKTPASLAAKIQKELGGLTKISYFVQKALLEKKLQGLIQHYKPIIIARQVLTLEDHKKMEIVRDLIDKGRGFFDCVAEAACLLGFYYKQIDVATGKSYDEKRALHYFKLAADKSGFLILQKEQKGEADKTFYYSAAYQYAHSLYSDKNNQDLKEAKRYFQKAIQDLQKVDKQKTKALCERIQTKINLCDNKPEEKKLEEAKLALPPDIKKLKRKARNERRKRKKQEQQKELKASHKISKSIKSVASKSETVEAKEEMMLDSGGLQPSAAEVRKQQEAFKLEVFAELKNAFEKEKQKEYLAALKIVNDAEEKISGGNISSSKAELKKQCETLKQNILNVAWELHDEGRYTQAQTIAESVQIKTKRSLCLQLSSYRHRSQYEKALNIEDELSKRFPDDSVLQAGRLLTLYRMGKEDQGESTLQKLEKIVSLSPNNLKLTLMIVRHLIDVGNITEAKKRIEVFEQKEKDSLAVQFPYAKCLLAEGRYKEALDILARFPDPESKSAKQYRDHLKMVAIDHIEDEEKAAAFLNKLRSDYPQNLKLVKDILGCYKRRKLYLQGLLFLKTGKVSFKIESEEREASPDFYESVFKKIKKQYMVHPQLVSDAIVMFFKVKQYYFAKELHVLLKANGCETTLALFASMRSMEQQSLNTQVNYQISFAQRLFYRQGKTIECEEILLKVEKQYPYRSSVYQALIYFYLASNQYDKFYDSCQKLLKHLPRSYKTYLILTRAYLIANQINKVKETERLALATLPEDKLLARELSKMTRECDQAEPLEETEKAVETFVSTRTSTPSEPSLDEKHEVVTLKPPVAPQEAEAKSSSHLIQRQLQNAVTSSAVPSSNTPVLSNVPAPISYHDMHYNLARKFEKSGPVSVALYHYRIAAEVKYQARLAIASIFTVDQKEIERDKNQAVYWHAKYKELYAAQTAKPPRMLNDAASLPFPFIKFK